MYVENGSDVLRIGDEDRTLTSRYSYVISHDLAYRPDDFDNSDELALDLLPTGWETSIRESSIKMTMPKKDDLGSDQEER